MSGGRVRAWAWAAPALALVAVLVAGAAVIAQQSAVVVHQCVTAGQLGRFGVSLTLLRADPTCPAGTYGVGEGQRIIGVVVVVAVPVLLAHLVGAVLGAGLAARLHGVVRAAVVAVAGRRSREPEPPALPVVAATAPVDVPVRLPRPRAVPGGPRWRGPPEVSVA